MPSFHARGAAAYGAAIRAEYNSQIRDLEDRLRRADSEQERNRLAEELREVKAQFRVKNAQLKYSLF
jgi:hypothetical protein